MLAPKWRGRGGHGFMFYLLGDLVVLAANILLCLQGMFLGNVCGDHGQCVCKINGERNCRSYHTDNQHQDHLFANREQSAGCHTTKY